MRFVLIRHPALGVTSVPESRVPHLAKGWELVEQTPDVDPTVDDAPTFTSVESLPTADADTTAPGTEPDASLAKESHT